MSDNNNNSRERALQFPGEVGDIRLSKLIFSDERSTTAIGVIRPTPHKDAPTTLSTSYGSASSSSWRGSPTLTSSRPTKDEASALLEIMSTPPQSYKDYSRDGRGKISGRQHDFKRSQSLPSSNSNYISNPLATSLLVSPRNISSVNRYEAPSTLYGPPYESSLPHKPTPSLLSSSSLSPNSKKRCSLLTRRRSPPKKQHDVPSIKNCRHFGLGPFLSILPESVIYSIIGYIDYFDRHPTMLLVSHGMSELLTRPEFLFELKHAHERRKHHSQKKKSLLSLAFGEDVNADEHVASNELLFIVGGKCPTKTNNNNSFSNGDSRGEGIQFASASQQPIEGGMRMNRRMEMQSNEHFGILGYDQRRKNWVRFGGDPLGPWRDNISRNAPHVASSLSSPDDATLHPLSPFGIVDAKPLYIGHPYYSLLFFGGTHYGSNRPSRRVTAYSFLTSQWEHWPDMMRARHGDDFVVARAEGAGKGLDDFHQEGETSPYSCTDSIVLIGCDLELCDCFRCNPPSSAYSKKDNPDMNIDVVSFAHNECGDVCFAVNDDSLDNSQKTKKPTMGQCEVLNLKSRQWTRRKSRAPSCPPDDGGVAVIGGRFIYLPGTCPPPPTTMAHMRQTKGGSCASDDGKAAEVVTPLSQSEANSHAELSKSPSSTFLDIDQTSSSSMDTESENFQDDEIMASPLGDLFRSLHYRPGLRYDFLLDRWSTLPARPYLTTSSPTTCTFNDRVLVLGGYRSSSENALSCYHHREEDSILDYEDHLDYTWWYEPPTYHIASTSKQRSNESILEQNVKSNLAESDDTGEWTFGGGSTMFGHRQAWAHSSEMATAVAAASALKNEMNSHAGNSSIDSSVNLPCGAPMPVRGATTCMFQGRLTILGGLSTFSRTFYDSERAAIWQFFPEHCEWRRAPMTLPVPALLDGCAFSIHI